MQYTERTESYNDRRYGKPWMAIITTSLTRDFAFVDWDGRPGCAGQFTFSAEPGTLLAYGQKDIRKNRGGVDGYQICLPDGSLPIVSSEMAVQLRPLSHDERWREYAQRRIKWAMTRPDNQYKLADWEKDRNTVSARFSAMLGIPDPVMAVVAEAFGLTEPATAEHDTKPASVVDLSAFGL